MWLSVLILLIVSPAIFWGAEWLRQLRIKRKRIADNPDEFWQSVQASYPALDSELVRRFYKTIMSLTSFQIPPRMEDSLRLFGIGGFLGSSLDEVIERVCGDMEDARLQNAIFEVLLRREESVERVSDLIEVLSHACAK